MKQRITILALATAAASAMTLLSTTASASADAVGSGYSIRHNGYADGDHIGARVLSSSGQVVYRVDPRRSAAASAYGPARMVTNFNPKVRGELRRTRQAAYIVSMFGRRHYAAQSAGVDADLYALLNQGSWSLNNRYAIGRLNQTPYGSTILNSFAKPMLAEAAKYAGPYKARITSTRVPAGTASSATFTIKSAAGYAMAGVPVTFKSGTTLLHATTNSIGQATVSIPTSVAGPLPITVTSGRLPEYRLYVHTPKVKGAARVVDAGRSTTLSVTGSITVYGEQQLTQANGSALRYVGQPLSGTVTLTGGYGPRTLTFQVFANDTTISDCTTTALQTWTVTEPGPGTYPLPNYVAPRTTNYHWQATASSNQYSAGSPSTCSDLVKVKKNPTLAISRYGTHTTFTAGSPERMYATISGLDRTESVTLTEIVYGPFPGPTTPAACTPSKKFTTRTIKISHNGKYLMPVVKLSRAGNYRWRITAAGSNFIGNSQTGCGIATHVH